MNTSQRQLILVGTSLFLIQGLFPPWMLTFTGGNYPPKGWSEGFAFLLAPPSPSVNAYQYNATLKVQLDWRILLSLWSITAFMTFASVFLFRKRRAEVDDLFFNMLSKRKILFSLIIGAAFPFPFFGYPMAYLAAWLLLGTPTFEAQGWSTLAFLGILALAAIVFLILLTAQLAKSNLAKRLTIAFLVLALFSTSILAPVVKNYVDHARQ